MKKVIALFFIWRLLLFLPVAFAPHFLPQNHAGGITNMWSYTRAYPPVSSQLFFPWANFDGVHYLIMGWEGYAFDDDGRFFPLYPMLIHFFTNFFSSAVIFGEAEFFAGFIIPNVCLFLSVIFLYKLLRLDLSDNVAFRSILFLLLFPVSFFYGAVYSESLFLLLSVLSLYCARKNHWMLASLCGMWLAITRIVGIAILPVLLFELLQQEEFKFHFLQLIKRGWSLLLVPLGLMSFLIFSWYRWHNALYFVKSQSMVGSGRATSFVFPLQTVFRYIKIIISLSPHQFEWWIALLELASFTFACWFIYILWRKKIRGAYIWFVVLCFIVPISSGTFSGLPRYVLTLFPLFIGVALLKQKWLQVIYVVICLIALGILLTYFAQGYFIA